MSVRTVSYTHLDVYKRQVISIVPVMTLGKETWFSTLNTVKMFTRNSKAVTEWIRLLFKNKYGIGTSFTIIHWYLIQSAGKPCAYIILLSSLYVVRPYYIVHKGRFYLQCGCVVEWEAPQITFTWQTEPGNFSTLSM